MIKRNFKPASVQGDWTMPMIVDVSKYAQEWTDDCLGEFHMAPDGFTGWDDYGIRRTNPSPPRYSTWFTWEASTDDGTDRVIVVPGPYGPALQVTVPAHVMSNFGPGMTSLGMHFVRKSTGQRVTLLNGRLPIVLVP